VTRLFATLKSGDYLTDDLAIEKKLDNVGAPETDEVIATMHYF